MTTDETGSNKSTALVLEDYRTYGEHLKAALGSYYDSLSERNKIRKAMLIAASISLAASYTTILPNKIEVLGIQSQDIPHLYIYLMFSIFCAYFGVHFAIAQRATKVKLDHLAGAAGRRKRIRSVLTKELLTVWEIQQLEHEFELEYMLPINLYPAGKRQSWANTSERQKLLVDAFQIYLPSVLCILAVLWPIFRAWQLVE